MKKQLAFILAVVMLALSGCSSEKAEDVLVFHGKAIQTSDLSQETIEWLERYNNLTEAEQLFMSSIPAELYALCEYPTANDAEAGESEGVESWCVSRKEDHDAAYIALSAEDSRMLMEMVKDGDWIGDCTKCASDYVFLTGNGDMLYYHAACGMINDEANTKSLQLSQAQMVQVNDLLERTF